MSAVRTLLLGVLLILVCPLSDVFAQKGRSYSSGGRSSSPSRPSPGGRSSSSPARSPSPNRSPTPTRSFPSPPSGFGTNRSQPAPRPAPIPSSPSGRSYTNRPPSTPTPSTPNFPGNKSSPSRPPSSQPPSSRPPAPYSGTQPGDPGFDRPAAEAQRRAESKARYSQGENPKPTYTDPTGTSRPIDPRDHTIEDLRKKLDHERWQNRDWRRQKDFGDYVNRPIIVYRDPYSSWFWYWLLAQNLDTRSNWAYHHRRDIDDARYRDMVTKDAHLEERVKKMEDEKVQRDPTYVPPGVDSDLMYSDEYVDAVYNPKGPSLLGGLKFLLKTALILAVFAFLIWLVFIKQWAPPRSPKKAARNNR